MTTQTEAAPAPKIRTFREFLEKMTGKAVTVVNPESFEDAPVGFQLSLRYYDAKLMAVGDDYIHLATQEEQATRKGEEPEAAVVQQIVPIEMIKRISTIKGDRMIHL